MEPTALSSPVVVCLDAERDADTLVRCGVALALAWGAPLYLAIVVVLPVQRPLGHLAPDEERAANTLLDVAEEHAAASGIVPIAEIWVARGWKEALRQMTEELTASALVIGPRTSGPLAFLDDGRTLLQTAPCPVIMVGGGATRPRQASWPPHWLAEADLSLSD